ncbi:MAG TPA: VOC family protein [Natronosporangium sp.]|nr:VOC family protein [Natronosporangium sp.]
MSNVIPTLGYRDPRAAVRFLVEALGFTRTVFHDDPVTGEVHHAELCRPDGGRVGVHSAAPGLSVADLTAAAGAGGEGGPDGYPPFSVHIDTDDPDGAYQRAVAAGATVVRELQDRPVGTRNFIVRDPEGLYWSVGTPLPPLGRDADGRWRPVTGSGG